MSLTPEEVKQLNKLGQRFGSLTLRSMKSNAQGSLATKTKGNNTYRDGQIEAIGFVFKRYGVFVEMGVFGGLTREQARAQGKLKPQPWFNPAIDKHIPKLEKELADNFENFAINAAQLKIKHTP